MENVLVVSLLVLASLRPASTEEKFIKEGGSVTLDLRPAPSDPIIIIQWKFKDGILAEWVKDVLPLAHNREHIKLDIASGRLAMEKMTKAHEGVYSVEVNNLVQKVTYNVVFIKDVPKPDIWVAPLTCSHESDQCTLSCEGDTTGAEPVTYSWKTDDGEWKESRKDMPITKKDHGQVKTFTCRMNNSVSEEESDPFTNRLYPEKKPHSTPEPVIGFVVVLLLAVVVGGVAWVILARKYKKWPFEKRNIDPETPNGNDAANEALLKLDAKPGSQVGPAGGAEPSNTSLDAKPGSQEGPAGGAEPSNTSLDQKPGIQDELTGEPADPLKASREGNPAEGEADAKL
ncbi:uncharacterized protein LOC117562567 isoform X2 [Gymnodraco acuticeps]|uniref:Uncharacterized protein LOC117562567 isoform X2 n=1 Tax=Gymnodraco acuticeps TaxID=8218 RepID=A0A6P8WFZ6_GYMAC|nr:uncharacterized protein LOC117562567 isoform X2 [Gymnodraco acuticeps]